MYNLYFKGLTTDNQQLTKIKKTFKEKELDFTNVFDNYGNLPLISNDELKIQLTMQLEKTTLWIDQST